MVGKNDALCVDWRVMGFGDIAGVCGAEVEVLKSSRSWCTIWREKEFLGIALRFGSTVLTKSLPRVRETYLYCTLFKGRVLS